MKTFLVEKSSYLSIVLLVTLAGCQSQNGINIPPTQDLLEQAATVLLKTPTIDRTNPTATAMATAVEAQPTVSATSTLSPTTTPIPTLTNEQETGLLSELMQLDDSCPLPCWWGIVPNESLLDPVLMRLKELGFRVELASAGMRAADDFLVFLDFDSSEEVVTTIKVTGRYEPGEESVAYSQAFARGWKNYSIMKVLGRYGPPSQVFIYSPFRADPGGGPSYHLLMFYEDEGFVIEYRGDAEQFEGSRYRACPDLNNVWEIHLFLYQPGTIDSVVETVLPADSLSYLGDPDEVYNFIRWEEATGMSLETFNDLFISPDDAACIEFSTPFP